LKEFSYNNINWVGEDNDEFEVRQWVENKYPIGLVPLEKIFYWHDMYKKSKEANKPEDVIRINICSEVSLKII